MRREDKQNEMERILSAIKNLDGRFDEYGKTMKEFKYYLETMNEYVEDLLVRVAKLEDSQRQNTDKTDYLQSQIDSIAKKVEEMRNGSDCIVRHGKVCAIRKEPLYDYAEQLGLERRDVLNILEQIGMLRKSKKGGTRTTNVRPPQSKRVIRAIKVCFDD